MIGSPRASIRSSPSFARASRDRCAGAARARRADPRRELTSRSRARARLRAARSASSRSGTRRRATARTGSGRPRPRRRVCRRPACPEGQLARSTFEVRGVRERRADLVLDVHRVGSIVAAASPERREVRAALHVLRQARRPNAMEHGEPVRLLRARGDQHAVTDRGDRPGRREHRGGQVLHDLAAEVLLHPGAWPPARNSASNALASHEAHVTGERNDGARSSSW